MLPFDEMLQLENTKNYCHQVDILVHEACPQHPDPAYCTAHMAA